MNLFRSLFRGVRSNQQEVDLRDKLPQVNGFVDVAVGPNGPRESIPIDDITGTSLVARCPEGLERGASVDFLYTNLIGRFRFATRCLTLEGREAHFELPVIIKTLQTFGYRRNAQRIQWLIPVQWRYAPEGIGYGNYLAGSLNDLSRTGASLVVERELKSGSQVEIRFALKPDETFVALCQVVRAAKIDTSARSAVGIRFIEIDALAERKLVDYICERQTLRHDRGFV
jgi:hypothetical protein